MIQYLGDFKHNHLWIKRDDLIPFSFGGNKARKAELFFEEIDDGEYDCVVTYGTSSSNHCRIISNQCSVRGINCYIISPEEESNMTFNSQMMKMFGAEITIVPIVAVHKTIQEKLEQLIKYGKKPYFIPGGGHGDIGTKAYVQCYEEIKDFELEQSICFDYIFFASGTGTTQAGLVCGQMLHKDKRRIVGISIARKNPRGRNVVLDSICSYLKKSIADDEMQANTIFIDDYASSYGKLDIKVLETVENILECYGIPLDMTYTGKAFMGMSEYIESKHINRKNILFIHTGGTPLFFDTLSKIREGA